MPKFSRTRMVALCAVASSVVLCSVAAQASAGTVPVDLRVLTISGRVLADQRQYTDATAVRTDPGATCFGTGTGGSGRSVPVPGATALGVLRDASESDPDLRPLSVTDYDFGFPGLGLCGIGSERVRSSQFWFLKVNHRNPQASGDQTRVGGGDSVIWYLIPYSKCDSAPPYYCPPELALRAPARAEPGAAFGVHVLSISDAGRATPAKGVMVDGADLPTDASGNTQVLLAQSRRIRAVRPGNIPSAPVFVCASADASACPSKRGREIIGSSRPDTVAGTAGPDTIRSRSGADVVNVRGGGADTVDCGPGRDRVVLGPEDSSLGCERESRPG